MENEIVNIPTAEGQVEYRVDHETDSYIVMSNVYGCVAVVSRKRVIFDVVGEDEVDDMQDFDYRNDYIYLIENRQTINVMVLEGVPYEELDLTLSDLQQLV